MSPIKQFLFAFTAMVPKLKYAETYVDYSLYCWLSCQLNLFFLQQENSQKHVSMATIENQCPLHISFYHLFFLPLL